MYNTRECCVYTLYARGRNLNVDPPRHRVARRAASLSNKDAREPSFITEMCSTATQRRRLTFIIHSLLEYELEHYALSNVRHDTQTSERPDVGHYMWAAVGPGRSQTARRAGH